MRLTPEQVMVTRAIKRTYGYRNVRLRSGGKGTGRVIADITLDAGLLVIVVDASGALHPPMFTRRMFALKVGRG